MAQPAVQLVSIDEDKSQSQNQQHEIKISIAPQANRKPCPDLLDGSRLDYITTGIPLYEASIRGDWKTAKEILDRRPELVRYSLTENGETAFHIAASGRNTKQYEDFVENLMGYMEVTDLEIENENSNTALYLAAVAGNVRIVKIIMKKNKSLVATTGSHQMTPLYMAALLGNHDMVSFLYENSHNLGDDCWTPENRGWLLLKCVETDMFDIALKIVQNHPELGSSGNVLGVLAKKTDIFSETEPNIFKRTFNWIIHPKKQILKKENKATALELLRIIWLNIAKKPKRDIDNIIRGPPDPPIRLDDKRPSDKEEQTLELLVQIRNSIRDPAYAIPPNVVPSQSYAQKSYSSRILFVAAEMGNTRFIIELIRQYPDLIWKVNDNNQTVFHVATTCRHEGIYNILYEVGSMKDLITPLKDNQDNNMLHLVGKRANKWGLEDVSGIAFQMQRELLWFKEVEKMIPPSYRERRNKEGLTPYELFNKEHKDIVKQGVGWMKDTASQCMVVATLIATIVFAAAFTVPGGYDQNDGIPFFYQKETFIVFVVADALSLFSSSASILMFLSVLTTGYAERDFMVSLPTKLTLGLTTLFFSITTMMIAFSASFFVLYHKDLKWIPIFITCFATMPVLLFAWLQIPVLQDALKSTYGSRYLFQPDKRVLYCDTSVSKRWWFSFSIPFVSRCTSKILKLL